MDDLSRIIADAKQRYGKVFAAEDMGTVFYFRPMTNADLKLIRNLTNRLSSFELEEMLIDRCVIWPLNHDYDLHSAGFVSSLCDEIRENSAFDDPDRFLELIDEARNAATKVTILIKAMIIAAMPTVSSDDIDNMSLYKLTETLALAERVLEIQRLESPPKLTLQEDEQTTPGAPPPGVDPIAEKLKAGMAKAMAEAGVNPANMEKVR